jgi:ABC-2 type transport system permease protein
MRNVLLILSRELNSYARTPSAYFIAAVILGLEGLLFNAVAVGDQARLSAEILGWFFYVAGIFTIVAGCFFSLRMLAEDGWNGTDVLLLTSPLRESEIVVGKYLASLVFLTVLTLLSIYMPALILVNGKISWGHVAAGYTGVLLIGASVLAIGMFASSLTSGAGVAGPLLAIVLTAVGAVALESSYLVAQITDPPFDEITAYLAPHTKHFSPSFQVGIVRLSDFVFFGSIIYLSLFAATKVLQSRRWR